MCFHDKKHKQNQGEISTYLIMKSVFFQPRLNCSVFPFAYRIKYSNCILSFNGHERKVTADQSAVAVRAHLLDAVETVSSLFCFELDDWRWWRSFLSVAFTFFFAVSAHTTTDETHSSPASFPTGWWRKAAEINWKRKKFYCSELRWKMETRKGISNLKREKVSCKRNVDNCYQLCKMAS